MNKESNRSLKRAQRRRDNKVREIECVEFCDKGRCLNYVGRPKNEYESATMD